MNNDEEFIAALESLIAEGMLETIPNSELMEMLRKARAIDNKSNLTDRVIADAMISLSREIDHRGLRPEEASAVIASYEESSSKNISSEKPKKTRVWILAFFLIAAAAIVIWYAQAQKDGTSLNPSDRAAAMIQQAMSRVRRDVGDIKSSMTTAKTNLQKGADDTIADTDGKSVSGTYLMDEKDNGATRLSLKFMDDHNVQMLGANNEPWGKNNGMCTYTQKGNIVLLKHACGVMHLQISGDTLYEDEHGFTYRKVP